MPSDDWVLNSCLVPDRHPIGSRQPYICRMESSSSYFVDTPRGIFTARGTWYRARLEDLREFAGAVLDREGPEALLERADRWLDAPRVFGLWGVLAFLLAFPALVAALLAVVWVALIRLAAPSGGGVMLGRVLRVMALVPLQFVGYAGVLSWFAIAGDEARVIVGLVGFVLLRWEILRMVFDRVLVGVLRRLYPLGEPDQTLRAVLIKSALRHGIDLPAIGEMEERLLRQVADSAGGRIAQGHSPRNSDPGRSKGKTG